MEKRSEISTAEKEGYLVKDWSGRTLCFECAKKLGANINIGRKQIGRCQRCHSEQTLFKVTAVPIIFSTEDTCAECGHPAGTHAATCRHSELETLKRERAAIVKMLESRGDYDPDRPLAEQLGRLLGMADEGENGRA